MNGPEAMSKQRGVSLIETLIALLLITIAMMTVLVYAFTAMQSTRHNKDKNFAIQKAIAILEEMKGVVERNDGDAGAVLDGYDNGATTSPTLTAPGTSPSLPSTTLFCYRFRRRWASTE